jgi:hypothetical protein
MPQKNPLEKLLQMADLIGCPEKLIISQYERFSKESSCIVAYKACQL